MVIFKFNILPLAEIERREAFKEAVNNCPHCGTKMKFHVEVDFLTNKIIEDGYCDACSTKVLSSQHPIQ